MGIVTTRGHRVLAMYMCYKCDGEVCYATQKITSSLHERNVNNAIPGIFVKSYS